MEFTTLQKNDPKPGYKTTEFWVTAVAQVIGILALFGVIEPAKANILSDALVQVVGGLMAALSALGYSISRGQAKRS